MSGRPRQGFERGARLLRGGDFRRVMRRGIRLDGPLFTLWAAPSPTPEASRLGLAASRKMGDAVRRNRAKRLLRETFRRQPRPQGLDVVVAPKKAILEQDQSEVDDEWRRSLRRLAGRFGARPSHPGPPPPR